MRRSWVELGWGAFAFANLASMLIWERWETVPFHFIWVSLTLLYGFRVWRTSRMVLVLGAVCVSTGALLLVDVIRGTQDLAEITEVPLMSAMFLAMAWHARRRHEALAALELVAEQRASLLERQERFAHDASHELRTPLTIARGHLEVLVAAGYESPEVAVALDELNRMNRIVERLLLLVKSDQPDFVVPAPIEVESFLEDVFLRWSEVAARSWRLGPLAAGVLQADPEAVRTALDALLENAVKYTDPHEEIELSSRSEADVLVVEVRDRGRGISEHAVGHIFERFARADAARSRSDGGVGLGLAIVDAIAKAHRGRCSVRTGASGTTFALRLPVFAEGASTAAGASLRAAAVSLGVGPV